MPTLTLLRFKAFETYLHATAYCLHFHVVGVFQILLRQSIVAGRDIGVSLSRKGILLMLGEFLPLATVFVRNGLA